MFTSVVLRVVEDTANPNPRQTYTHPHLISNIPPSSNRLGIFDSYTLIRDPLIWKQGPNFGVKNTDSLVLKFTPKQPLLDTPRLKQFQVNYCERQGG